MYASYQIDKWNSFLNFNVAENLWLSYLWRNSNLSGYPLPIWMIGRNRFWYVSFVVLWKTRLLACLMGLFYEFLTNNSVNYEKKNVNSESQVRSNLLWTTLIQNFRLLSVVNFPNHRRYTHRQRWDFLLLV